MPKSKKKHHKRYDLAKFDNPKLKDVELLLSTIVNLKLDGRIKKRMLNRAIWLVVELTGNFCSRYRSAGVRERLGVPIQRDHVYPRKTLVEELLTGDADMKSIIERARQVCIVTRDEHRLLSDVGDELIGWERYREAGVDVWDMSSETRLNLNADA